jgi:hypothetical protein
MMIVNLSADPSSLLQVNALPASVVLGPGRRTWRARRMNPPRSTYHCMREGGHTTLPRQGLAGIAAGLSLGTVVSQRFSRLQPSSIHSAAP